MATLQAPIESFIQSKSIAVYGVSRTGKKFGNFAYRALRERGYHLYPIHPEVDQVEGDRCFREIGDIPDNVDAALIVLPAVQAEAVLSQIASAGVKNIWLQQGAESDAALRICKEEGLNVVHGQCILMFAEPSGFHKVHQWIWKLLGKIPKDNSPVNVSNPGLGG